MINWFHPHMATEADTIPVVSRETHLRAEQVLQKSHNFNELSLLCSLWPFPDRDTLCETLSKRTEDFLDHTLSSLPDEEFEPNPCLDLSTYQKAEKIVGLLRRKQVPDWQMVQTSPDLSSLADANTITAEVDHRVRLLLRSVPFCELVRYAHEHDAQLGTLQDDITILEKELRYYFCTLRESTKQYEMPKEVSPLEQCWAVMRC